MDGGAGGAGGAARGQEGEEEEEEEEEETDGRTDGRPLVLASRGREREAR